MNNVAIKTDELAFFNNQLAAMLRDGIPLEGALAQLTREMRAGEFRHEVEKLREDLERGTPLGEALGRRKLPQFYTRMVTLGAAAQDLPAMLTLLADYYHRASATWVRLKGLLIYPGIVVTVALSLSGVLALFFSKLLLLQGTSEFAMNPAETRLLFVLLWLSPALMAILAGAFFVALSVPSLRMKLRWQLPAFHEASLAQFASAMTLSLRNGIPLPEALRLVEAMENGTPVAPALAAWRQQITAGQGRAGDWRLPGKAVPPLFLWLIRSSGDDLPAGFQKAAELYGTRSAYRTDLLLYGVLPVSVLLLGQMIIWQIFPAVHFLVRMMNMLGDVGG